MSDACSGGSFALNAPSARTPLKGEARVRRGARKSTWTKCRARRARRVRGDFRRSRAWGESDRRKAGWRTRIPTNKARGAGTQQAQLDVRSRTSLPCRSSLDGRVSTPGSRLVRDPVREPTAVRGSEAPVRSTSPRSREPSSVLLERRSGDLEIRCRGGRGAHHSTPPAKAVKLDPNRGDRGNPLRFPSLRPPMVEGPSEGIPGTSRRNWQPCVAEGLLQQAARMP